MPRSKNGLITNDWDAAYTAQEYIEPDRDAWTGLYDHTGTPLYRPANPIGYDPHRYAAKPQGAKHMASKPDQKKTYTTKKTKKAKGK